MHPSLKRILDQVDHQSGLIDELCGRVETEDRDFTEAELTLLEQMRDRIKTLQRQAEPLREAETLRAAHEKTLADLPAASPDRRTTPVPAGQVDEPPPWRHVGEFIRDMVGSFPNPHNKGEVDTAMAGRVAAYRERAVADQTTGDTPGLLPSTIVGEVVTDLDGARPFVGSLGVRNLAQVAGATFNRPHVTQHTLSGAQSAEKGELPSQKLTVAGVPFTKTTRGGSLDVSRQDIDWTDPSAWQAIVGDMMNIYAADTDDTAAAALSTAVTQSVELAADPASLQQWIDGLYGAAQKVVTADGSARASSLRLPNIIWTSVDTWALIGAVIDAARAQARPEQTGLGGGGIATVNGTVLDVPRVMVPGLPAGTVILGRTNFTEFYEERIGLLQAVQPSLLGVEIAYGGYIAFGTLDATAFCKVEQYTP